MNLVLPASALWSKWGFNDGDCPDWVSDHYDDEPELQHLVENNWHQALTVLVYDHLLPALDTAGHPTQVMTITTIHNPVRAVDWDTGEPEWAYTVSATIDEADILNVVEELAQ